MNLSRKALGIGLFVVLQLLATSAIADEHYYDIDLPSQSLIDSFKQLGTQTGLQFFYTDKHIGIITAGAVQGRLTLKESVARLLANSDVNYQFTHADTVRLFFKSSPVLVSTAKSPSEMHATQRLLEEIVVSARKKANAESVQKTPIAMSVVSAQQFKVLLADDVSELGFMMPNVELKQAGQVGVQNFMIRGMGASGTTPSDSPAVGVFQNGVFWGSNYGSLLQTFDIESIEVLRGPQGTLLGRNVTAGAVVINTKRPESELGVDVEAVLGSYGRQDYSIGVEGELLANTLAARVVLLDRSFDGYYFNEFTGQTFGDSATRLLRATLVAAPTDALDVALIFERYRQTGSSQAAIGIEVAGNLPDSQVGYHKPADAWHLRLDNPGTANNTINSATLDSHYHLDNGIVTAISGYRKLAIDHNTDFDGTEFSGFNRALSLQQQQFSQELRFASNYSELFEYTVGLYYYQARQDYREGRDINQHSTVFAAGSHLDQTAWAAFGEFDWDLSSLLTLTIGGRYTQESIDAQAVAWGTCPLDASIDNPLRIRYLSLPCDLGDKRDASWSDFSPKIGLSYQLANQQMSYVSATRGFRSGGFSMRGTDIADGSAFDAEEVTAYEWGYKGDFLANHLRINAAAYYNDYDELQRTLLVSTQASGVAQTTANAAAATVKGVELDIVAQVSDNSVFSFSYGLTDASFNRYQGFDVNGGGYDVEVDAPLAKELEFTRVPKETYSASALYYWPIPGMGQLALRVAASKTGAMFFDDLNTLREPAYILWDASATLSLPIQQCSLAIFVKNITDQAYAFWGSSLGELGNNRFIGPPRTVGVTINFHY